MTDSEFFTEDFNRGDTFLNGSPWYAKGGVIQPRKIPVTIDVTREQLDDGRDSLTYIAIRKALGWPVTPEQAALWQETAVRAAEAKEERKRVRESTPTVPVTVDALMGLLWDTFRLDEDDVRHMLQPWCSCEQDSDNGMWRCEHYNDTF